MSSDSNIDGNNLCNRYLIPDSDTYLVRLFSKLPINIHIFSKNDLGKIFERLKLLSKSVLLFYNSTYIPRDVSDINISDNVQVLDCNTNLNDLPMIYTYFKMDNELEDHTPIIEIKHCTHKLNLHQIFIDFVIPLSRNKNPFDSLCYSLEAYFRHHINSLMYIWNCTGVLPKKIVHYHYFYKPYLYIISLPWTICDQEELTWRKSIHNQYDLSTELPLFRRGQALIAVNTLTKWLGPNSNHLVCPHLNIKNHPNDGKLSILTGRYTYKHYLQDNFDDKNWGCAYRSLQTLISWLMWQGEIKPSAIPSFRDIQNSLVRCGDKSQSFIGSRTWIGSFEVSYCLQELYGIECRLLHVSRGSQMFELAVPVLAQHFMNGGGPVMIGGGQLAHTIIGVHIPVDRGQSDYAKSRYLILDPHFTGAASDIKTIIDKGWCGWKSQNFWKADVFYNLCFLPSIKTNQV